MGKLDISELYDSKHNLKDYFEKIEIEKYPNKNCYLMHIYWKKSTCVFNLSACKRENNGTCWAICVSVDMSDTFLMDEKEIAERAKPKHEVIDVPSGIERVIVDRIKIIGKFILNGQERDAGLPDRIR